MMSFFKVPAILIAFTVIGSGLAAAEGASFCNLEEPNCVKLYVQNTSSTTVVSTTITQEAGKNECEGGIKKTITKNLVGGANVSGGESATFYADKTCKYKVKFKTTKGCSGDKTTHFNSKDIESGRNFARLKGACGTLKAVTIFRETFFQSSN